MLNVLEGNNQYKIGKGKSNQKLFFLILVTFLANAGAAAFNFVQPVLNLFGAQPNPPPQVNNFNPFAVPNLLNPVPNPINPGNFNFNPPNPNPNPFPQFHFGPNAANNIPLAPNPPNNIFNPNGNAQNYNRASRRKRRN